jgi:hypothetical protein
MRRQVSVREWVDWIALFRLEAEEAKAAEAKAGKGKRRAKGQQPRTLESARSEG